MHERANRALLESTGTRPCEVEGGAKSSDIAQLCGGLRAKYTLRKGDETGFIQYLMRDWWASYILAFLALAHAGIGSYIASWKNRTVVVKLGQSLIAPPVSAGKSRITVMR